MNEAVALAEERRLRRPSLAERFGALFVARVRPLAVVTAVVLVLAAGSGAAAAGSLPGDPAFALKRAAEEIELALAPDAAARTRVLAAHSERRLEELGRSAARPERSPTASAEYEAAVRRFAAAVAALRQAEPGAKREAVEQVVEAARGKHVQVLETLRQRLPENAQQKLDRASEQHEKIKQGGPDRPGAVPPGKGRDARESPRASETPRGGRPSADPPAKDPPAKK
jgi:hypothetical protein